MVVVLLVTTALDSLDSTHHLQVSCFVGVQVAGTVAVQVVAFAAVAPAVVGVADIAEVAGIVG